MVQNRPAGASHAANAITGPSIVLARHGRPALDRSQHISFQDYRAWWQAYDAGGLAAEQTPLPDTVAMAQRADLVYASTLRRAQETARWLVGNRDIISDPDLVEAPLPPPPLYGLRLKPGLWGVFARIAWHFGASGGLESRAEVQVRTDRACDRLTAAALGDGGKLVMVCAHGWVNRMMRPALHTRGWHCVEDGGDVYWSYRRYVPLV